MDSKSVHRVAGSLNLAARYDSKLKLWTIGGKTFTSEQISSTTSLDLRKQLGVGVQKEPPQPQPPAPSAQTTEEVVVPAIVPKKGEKVAAISVMFPKPKTGKRDVDGKIWLPGLGISKWQTRQKMIARGDKQGANELNKNRTQYLSADEAKKLAQSVFDSVDKRVLENPEQFSERVVACAKEAQVAANKLLAAADKAAA